ncbi:unnamed protein product [Allacma fusca]|uniref:F-box domain-containing protein n=1 Tax=Allacma fusca TaxID=39272 RepID=A0A8J2JE43_9HEXA|nr:unnamed protein product [Allacma fusca]
MLKFGEIPIMVEVGERADRLKICQLKKVAVWNEVIPTWGDSSENGARMADKRVSSKRRITSEVELPSVKIPKISNSDGKKILNQKISIVDSLVTNLEDSSFIKHSESFLFVDWMKLPEEIWKAIFLWIPTKEKVRSRLVSKAWKNNVDLLSSFKVRLDGRMGREKLEKIREKRIQTVELLSLQDGFEVKFKYPNYVKELLVTTLVSPANFVKCCEMFTEVQTLRFISTVKSDTTFDPRNKACSRKALACLKKLKEIDIMIHSFAPSKTLKSVTARICCATPLRSTLEQDVCFSTQPWFSELKGLNFQSLHIFHSQTCGSCDLDDVWNEILRSQTSLLRVTADYNDMTVSDVFEILRQNKSLRSCKIYRVICAYLFDVDGLQALNEVSDSLQELALDFVNSAVISCNPASALQLEMKFFDFMHLPTSLRKLSIRGYNLSKEQFLTTLGGLSYVEEFNVGNCVFHDASTRISLFKEILHTLGFDSCGVRRFLFDTFEIPELGDERKKWMILEDAALRFGILHHQHNSDEMDCERSFYDFRFTKLEIREFAAITDRVIFVENDICLINIDGAGAAMISVISGSLGLTPPP